MRINFNAPLRDPKGDLFTDSATLTTACHAAMSAQLPQDTQLPAEKRLAQYRLLQRVVAGGEQEVTAEEISELKDRVAKTMSLVVFGAVVDILESAKIATIAKPPAQEEKSGLNVNCGQISTGEYLIESVVNDCGLQEPPVNPNVLFDASSTSVQSPLFNVAEGEAVQLDAYSLCGGTAQVQKVLLSSPVIPLVMDGCLCAFPSVPAAEELAVKTMCNWTLTDCASTRYITVAGTYRLLIQEAMIGCAFIVMQRMQRRDYPIPEDMLLGA